MRILLFILACIFINICHAQSTYHMRYDTVKILRVGGNGELVIANAGRDSQKGGVLYNTGGGYTAFKKTVALNDSTLIVGGDTVIILGGVKGGSAIDTTSLSNRIEARLKISDTLLMLYPYLRKNDTASLSNRINQKLSISDTAVMLSIYMRKSDTVSLSNRIEQRMKYSDTTSLSNRIDGKQPAGNYITGLNGDVAATGPGLANAVLAPTSVTPGTYKLATVTVDQKGRTTAAAAGVVEQINDSTFRINDDTIAIRGTGSRFGLEDITATGTRLFDANNKPFIIDSTFQYIVTTKTKSSGVDKGLYNRLEMDNGNIYLIVSPSSGPSPRSYGFTAHSMLTQMFARGHVSGHDGYVQADTAQVLLESDPNRIEIRHDSITVSNFNGEIDLRIRTLPQTVDTSYKSFVSGPNGRVYLRPGANGGGGSPAGSDREIQINNAGAFGVKSGVHITTQGTIVSDTVRPKQVVVEGDSAINTKILFPNVRRKSGGVPFSIRYEEENDINDADTVSPAWEWRLGAIDGSGRYLKGGARYNLRPGIGAVAEAHFEPLSIGYGPGLGGLTVQPVSWKGSWLGNDGTWTYRANLHSWYDWNGQKALGGFSRAAGEMIAYHNYTGSANVSALIRDTTNATGNPVAAGMNIMGQVNAGVRTNTTTHYGRDINVNWESGPFFRTDQASSNALGFSYVFSINSTNTNHLFAIGKDFPNRIDLWGHQDGRIVAGNANYFLADYKLQAHNGSNSFASFDFDANTSSILYSAAFAHRLTAGAGASGFGAGFRFEGDNASNTQTVIADIAGVWSATPTAGVEPGDLLFRTRRIGALTEAIRVHSTGELSVQTVDSTNTPDNIVYHDPVTKKLKKAALPIGNISSGFGWINDAGTGKADTNQVTGLITRNDEYYSNENTAGLVVFYDDFKRGSIGGDYTTAFPATTATISRAGLTLSGTPNNYNNYILRNYSTVASKFKERIRYVNNTMSSTAYGIAVGIRSDNAFTLLHNVVGSVAQNTGNSDLGKSSIAANSTYSYSDFGTDAISSISVGDTIEIEIVRNGYDYTVTTTNLTTGQTSTNFNATSSGGSPFGANNTGRPVLHFLGGNVTIVSWEYRLIDMYNPDYCFVGNSITHGQAATVIDSAFATRTFANDVGIRSVTNAGGADYTQSVLDRLNEFYLLKPKTVFLMIGGNDILFSVSTATWQANLRAIRDSLVAHGIKVIHLAPTPRNSTNVMPLRDFIDTCVSFATDVKILKTFDSLATGGTNLISTYDAGDGVHLSNAGHRYVAELIHRNINIDRRIGTPAVPLNALIADGYDQPNAVLTNSGWKAEKNTQLRGTVTWDPPSIGANSSTTTTVTVTGASLGDPVTISKTSGSYSNGEIYYAYVSAPGTVTLQLHNGSGGSFNITSADFNIIVLKF